MHVQRKDEVTAPGEDHVETGVMWPKPRNVYSSQTPEEAGRALPPTFQRSLVLQAPWLWAFSPQDSERVDFGYSKPPSWWHLATAAPGHR